MNITSGARKPHGRLRANIRAVLLSSVLTVVAGEIVVGYLLWIFKYAGASSTIYYAASSMYSRVSRARQWIFYSPQSPYVPDDLLGYAGRPGLYTIKLTARTGNSHTF